MFNGDLIGRTLPPGYMLIVSDYAWKRGGAFCQILDSYHLKVVSAHSYSVDQPFGVILGNCPSHQGKRLDLLRTAGGFSLYGAAVRFRGNQFCNGEDADFGRVVPFGQVPAVLPDALSFIGLQGELLWHAVEFVKSAMCSFDSRYAEWQ